MASKRIIIKPRTSCLGADVSGIDLSKSLKEKDKKIIHSAWVEHKVLFFRDQHLTPEKHQAFAENFGLPQPAGFVPTLPDHPFVRRQEQPGKTKSLDIVWHADDIFLPIPSKGSILYALDVPEQGGDTVWSDMQEAYQALSLPWQRFIEDLSAINVPNADLMEIVKRFGAEAFAKIYSDVPPVSQPVVRVHPESGEKSIFVNPLNTSSIEGLSKVESETVLNFLFRHCQRAEFQVRLSWLKGTVAFWDNRSTIHMGIADYGDSHRLMHRVAIADTQAPQ
ncbi:MAG: TauD/TfdA family dioxygenase [Pseudomonadota bacterium]|nr:TauD/TfdA family dioxygenase [Pseudomonadota bacterium]